MLIKAICIPSKDILFMIRHFHTMTKTHTGIGYKVNKMLTTCVPVFRSSCGKCLQNNSCNMFKRILTNALTTTCTRGVTEISRNTFWNPHLLTQSTICKDCFMKSELVRKLHSLKGSSTVTSGKNIGGRSVNLPVMQQFVRFIARGSRGDHYTPVLNPIHDLQQHVVVPIMSEDDLVFNPTPEEVGKAQNIFLPGPKHKIEFLKSALFAEHLPEYDLPEVAFIGRSNVGKSSLIKMLLSGVIDLEVRVSKNPGHTKMLNFFQVGQKLCVVDMPGYGYRMPQHYMESVEVFLANRKKLSRTFFLVDGTTGVTETDVIGLNMLEDFHIPYVIVMTKIDKVKPSLLLKNVLSVLKYRDQTRYCFQQPFLISSVTGDGVALLQTFIAYVTGNFAVKGL